MKNAKRFKRACLSYFTDPDLIDWVWKSWNKIIPRQSIYVALKRIANTVSEDPHHDHRVDFSPLLINKGIGNSLSHVFGINMEEQRAWVTRVDVFAPGIYLAPDMETLLFVDWHKTIQDFIPLGELCKTTN